MDSESPLPAKRLRASLNGNLQLTECIREFKLPRQFPSMATQLSADAGREKVSRQNYHSSVPPSVLGRVSYNGKISQGKDTLVPNMMRKIKLRAKDGRDLGEVNVQHLPRNIQGKTICLAKNGIKPQPEVAQAAEKSRGLTIGVLTPVNVVRTETPVVYSAESSVKSLGRVVKVNNNKFIDISQDRDAKKTVIIDKKKISAATDLQARRQVLVIQSGKSWRMARLASGTTSTVAKPAQSKNTIVVGKWPQIPAVGKAASSQNQSCMTLASTHNSSEISSTLANKVSNCGQTSMVVKRWSQSRTPDSTTDRCKNVSPSSVEGNESSMPKIEVSRIFGTSGAKPTSQTRLPTENGKAAPTGSATLKQDVMVVLPGDVSVSLDEGSNSEPEVSNTSGSTVDNTGSAWRSKCSIGNSCPDSASKHSRYITSAKRTEKKSVDNEDKEENEQLSILEKALSSVEDEELRARALRVLAECGIGKERLVPIKPASDKKSVKDSDTQTSVFGLWDPEEFIYVPEERPVVQRKRPIIRQQPHNATNIFGNAHSQDFTLNSFATASTPVSTDPVLGNWVGEWLKGSEAATQVQNMLEKAVPNPVRPEVVEQLELDFQTYNVYDEDGLLNIHRAVLADHPSAVLRQLKVLKALRESVDLPTADGKVSFSLDRH